MSIIERLMARIGYLRAASVGRMLREMEDPLTDTQWRERSVSYATSTWVYRCANVVAESIAMVPLRLRRRDADGVVHEIEQHPVLQILERVNAANVYQDLWELWALDLGLAGNALWALERNAQGAPVEIHRLHPRTVTPHKHKTKYVDYYEYQPNPEMDPIRIPPEDVVHFQYTNPDNYAWGLAPWRAASEAIMTDLDAQKHNRALLKNHAVPRYALTTDKNMDVATRKTVLRSWAAMLRGPDNSGRTVLLHSGLRVERLTLTPEEMDWMEQRRVSRREIRVAYGVPPWLAGDPDDSTQGSPQDQELLFWDNTMATLARKRDRVLNREFLSQFPDTEGMYLESDLSMIPCIADREQARARERNKEHWSALQALAQTINEVRHVEGLPPVPWGDRPWMPVSMVQWSPGMSDGQKSYSLPPSPQARDARREAQWKAHYVQVRSLEPTMERIWKGIFERQEGEALAWVRDRFESGAAWERPAGSWNVRMGEIPAGSRSVSDEEIPAGSRNVRALEDETIFQPVTDAERKQVEATLSKAVQEGADTAASTYEISAAFDIQSDPEMLAWVRAHAAELSVYADATTLTALRPKLAAAIAEGATMNDLADIVQQVFQFAKFTRAARIAQTEVNRAAARGSIAQYRANNIRQKEWLSAFLPTTRPEHAAADGQVVGIDEAFDIGGYSAQGPGETGVPEHDINCHCAVAPVVE